MKVKNDHRSKFSNLSNWKEEIPLKPWFFQASSFQLLKLENLLRWSFFTFITALGLWNIYHGGTVGNLNCYKVSLDALPGSRGCLSAGATTFRILLMLGRVLGGGSGSWHEALSQNIENGVFFGASPHILVLILPLWPSRESRWGRENTVEPLLSGRLRDLSKCPLNTEDSYPVAI